MEKNKNVNEEQNIVKKTPKKATNRSKKTKSDINKIDTSKTESIEEKGIQVVDIIEMTKEKVNSSIKKNKGKDSSAYLLFKHFIKHLKEDKLYLLSAIITVGFLIFFSLTTLEKTDGYYDRKAQLNSNSNVTVPTDPSLKDQSPEEPQVKSEDVDVTGYVGIYSHEVTLTEPLTLNNSCTIESYKYIYEIESNKTITKYYSNDCQGTIKIWSDTLSYVFSGGARYISAHNINYLFSANSMKEVDAETYKIDEDLPNIKENNKQPSIENYFYSNNIIINTKKDLILIKGNSVSYRLSDNYNVSVASLDQTVAKTSKDNIFSFIAYQNKDSKKCFTKEELESEGIEPQDLYKVYSIKYNEENASFNSPKELISRKNTDTCEILEEDIASLSK